MLFIHLFLFYNYFYYNQAVMDNSTSYYKIAEIEINNIVY